MVVNVHQLRATVSTVARAARLHAELTQADVADSVGIATEVYGRLERSNLLPSVPTLRRLRLTLNVSADAFLGLSPSPVPPRVERPEQRDPPHLRRLLRTLRSLSPEQLRLIGTVATALNQAPHRKNAKGG
jgi:transcriptional regulator with XRE-family HTH domain